MENHGSSNYPGEVVIGIDFDNTLISYDELIHQIASEQNLISQNFSKNKKEIRDALRRLPNGDLEWQKIQAQIYGPRIREARLIPGVRDFFKACQSNGITIFIISHKTKYSKLLGSGVNFRKASLDWMAGQGFFSEDGLGISPHQVYFESTIEEKCQRIEKCHCTYFIDDLEEIFLSSSFPSFIQKILYGASPEHLDSFQVLAFKTWDQINSYFFNEDNSGHGVSNHWPVGMPSSNSSQKRGDSQTLPPSIPPLSTLTNLTGKKIDLIEKIGGGRNSQVYKLTTVDAKEYVAKYYFTHPLDKRDRLSIEFSSSQFLWKQGLRCIPRPVMANSSLNLGLYSYVEGQKIKPDEITLSDIEQAVQFLKSLHNLCTAEESKNISPASDACLCIQDILSLIERRKDRLLALPSTPETIPVHEYLNRQFLPIFQKVETYSKAQAERYNLSLISPLRRDQQTLSPSDFGFHNALRKADGTITFLDFEYFGWDDPTKLICDFLYHPGMLLSEELKQLFVQKILPFFDSRLELRLQIEYPLFGLVWCLILLNEFVPEHQERRQFATLLSEKRKSSSLPEEKEREKNRIETDIKMQQEGINDSGIISRPLPESVKVDHLCKAEELLHKINKQYPGFPYL